MFIGAPTEALTHARRSTVFDVLITAVVVAVVFGGIGYYIKSLRSRNESSGGGVTGGAGKGRGGDDWDRDDNEGER
jgi:predicted nucleic acid-binding Zn ribbon protein